MIALDALNPSQREILRLWDDSAIILWVGSVRSGKGVGSSVTVVHDALARFRKTLRPSTYILAGATSGSFMANNAEYLYDASSHFGLDARYTTSEAQPRIELALAGRLVASLRIYGAGNARSHFSLRGLTAQSAWIDEATLCHPDFIRTAFQRCSFADSRLLMTTNAAAPTNHIKRDWIDSSPAGLAVLETDFHENVHYADERRDILLSTNPHTADYARAIRNQWAGDEGQIIPILPEHYDDTTLVQNRKGDVFLDDGTAGTTAAILFVRTPYGHLAADEYYHDGQRRGRLTTEQHLIEITRRWEIDRLFIDRAAAGMKAQASRMGYFPRNSKSEFEPGVQSANNALYSGKIKVKSKACPNLISEAGGYVWSPSERAPIPTAPDHLMDCLRYAARELYPASYSMLL